MLLKLSETNFRAARHGLKLNGKLARINQQEATFSQSDVIKKNGEGSSENHQRGEEMFKESKNEETNTNVKKKKKKNKAKKRKVKNETNCDIHDNVEIRKLEVSDTDCDVTVKRKKIKRNTKGDRVLEETEDQFVLLSKKKKKHKKKQK